ncbi:conserved hypothetical protein [Flavobacterium sp. 9AF]|uniref:hypothetical protein n=1 Tax=Flavobacterium sp. 9AF TaxID=2653142 RepID=UPI0012F20F4F|nr:hypothetical protein [Flavobacterium sp. 9AF]VXB33925.1 conserved hypothetical protein [Flavobacterium sp. 9AF]
MKENKNIERLFQEKFKEFEASPPEDSWDIIASKIKEKKKERKAIPFWFKASGIAASFLIGSLLIFNYLSNDNDFKINEDKIVLDENKNIKDNNNTDSNQNKLPPNNSIVEKNKIPSIEAETTKFKSKPTQIQQKIKTSKEESWAHNSDQLNDLSNEKDLVKKEATLQNQLVKVVSNEATVNVSSKKNKNLDNKEDSFGTKSKLLTDKEFKNAISNSAQTTSVEVDSTKKVLKNNILSIKTASMTNSKFINKEHENSSTDSNKNSIASTMNETDNNSENEATFLEKNKGLLLEKSQKLNNNNDIIVNLEDKDKKNNAIIENKKNQNGIIKDSTIVIAEVKTEVNALEQLLKEKEEGKNADEKEEEKRSKWVVSTNAAPVYFNSISNGSPIDEQFANNEKNYAQTLSYGVGLQYDLTKKISIRSGINSININYNTNNVYYSSTLREVSGTNLNITKNSNGQNLVLRNSPATTTSSDISSLSIDVENMNEASLASLNQEMGYIEVPLELTYKIIDQKIGIQVIGGMSTLFLNKNNISLVSNGSEMEIGKANNLNDIHFSSNIGLGFNYKFLESFQLNVQPVFKYQINTFNSNAGNFKPYIVGLYSGLSFNF